nr:hypothetical protein [Tanacetum cinerariifolium]
MLKFVRICEDNQEYRLPIPDVMLTEESASECKLAKKNISSKRRVKKKVTLLADDNIIFDDPNAALELAKSISQTKAKKEKAAKKVHATHTRIMTESVPESAKKKSSSRSSKSVIIQDTSSTLKSKPATLKTKIKGAPYLTPQEQEGDEQDSEFFDDDNDDVEKDDKYGDADDEGHDHVTDTQDANDEDVENESDEDEIYKYKIRVRNEEDVERKVVEVEESNKGFGYQLLKLSSDSSLVSTVKDSADADVSSLLDIPIQHETPQTQSLLVQNIPVSVILKTTNLPPIPEIVTKTPVSIVVPLPQVTPIISSVQQTPTLIPSQPIINDALTITTAIPKSDALSSIELRVEKLEKDVSELNIVDHSFETLFVLQS